MKARKILGFVCLFSILCSSLFAQELTQSEATALRKKFVEEAKKYVGCPYEYGSIGPDTFDCSGLIYYTAKVATGTQLPRTAKAIYNFCRKVPDKEREMGDLLFFKTTDSGTISHVGIYIGNNQFISAISDGPNTGVIVSSLNQDYWKGKYVSCGQFIKASQIFLEDDYEEEVVKLEKEKEKVAKKKEAKKSGSFVDDLVFDATTCVNWSLFSMNQFMLQYRGIDVQTTARYTGCLLEPGLGFCFRFNTGLGLFQMPVLFTATVNEYFRFYAGPVISFGRQGVLSGTDKTVSPSFFPGIIGIAITTPSFDVAGVKLQIVQDISYTVFNNTDNSALSFLESLSAGFVMSTGIKVSLPMSMFR